MLRRVTAIAGLMWSKKSGLTLVAKFARNGKMELTSIAKLARSEKGGVTAEFAILLPVVVVTLALIVGGLSVSAQKIKLISAAAEIARLEARGDTAQAAKYRGDLGEGVEYRAVAADAALHCVTLRTHKNTTVLRAFAIEARSCAAKTDVT
ncbi:pilus assembly protein [Canibacter sp. lx-72]|uniref:TadE/TadG family type IV pilus assembly protein n=1 Tax=Canibacter zhuwentaonis TaxID=2837491 RepID=UPI001BDBC5B5|nr:pilus assembly protein [Canibacter zhuwentaonis]